MNGWHYLLLFFVGSLATWAGAIACAQRRRWAWVATAFVPFVVGAIWFFGIWTQLDWDSSFFDQKPWLIAAEFVLLAVVWATAVGAWAAARRRPEVHRRNVWTRAA